VKVGYTSGCSAYVDTTYQMFNFKGIENAEKVEHSKPWAIFSEGDGASYVLSGSICRGGYTMSTEEKPMERVKASSQCEYYSNLKGKMVKSTAPNMCIGKADSK
jgi:hypothetical protein